MSEIDTILLNRAESENRSIRKVTYLGIVVNIVLSIIKIAFGIVGNSIALIADGIHSFSDLLTDAAVIIGVRYSSKEPDFKHPYGHGRAETFAAVFISILLLGVGLAMVYYAGRGITEQDFVRPKASALIVAIVSIFSKEWVFRVTRKVARQSGSSALYANAWHHRSDALSSVAVVFGLISMMMGFQYGDHLAAVVVGLMVARVAWAILGQSFREFSEAAVDMHTIDKIKSIINENPDIHQWHQLRSRSVGREVFIDLHILVEPTLDVKTAHQISEDLENAIKEQVYRPVFVIIHIEPDIPELRK